MAGKAHPAMRLQYGNQHRQPILIPAVHCAAGSAERSRGNQRLDFDQHGAGPFNAGKHRRAWRPEIPFGKEQLGRVAHFTQAIARHLEHADFVGRTKPVLNRPEYAELLRTLALEREHCIDHMLDDAWSCELAVFGHMSDQDDHRAGALGEADQSLRARAHLGDGARCRLGSVGPHGLNGIDDDEFEEGWLRRASRRCLPPTSPPRAARERPQGPSARLLSSPGRLPPPPR